MGILRNLFGSLTAAVVRLAILAGVLLVGYLLIVKPFLKTADEALQPATGLDRIGKLLQTAGPQIEHEVQRALHLVKAQGGDPHRLVRCVEHAHQDTKKIERCTRRF